jgi:hypothetical protein
MKTSNKNRLTTTEAIGFLLLQHPTLSIEDLAERLAEAGFPVPTDFCLSQLRASFLRTLKFLDRAGLLRHKRISLPACLRSRPRPRPSHRWGSD